MAQFRYGRHNTHQGAHKQNVKVQEFPFYNNITRRPVHLPQQFHQRKLSSSLASASLKSLRLYRHICRLIPFILKIHEITHRVTPLQSKIYIANHFRKNALLKQPKQIDDLVQFGYQISHQAEMHYTNTGYIYKYLMSNDHHIRDRGINRYDDLRATKINRDPPSSFLKEFYKGSKTHDL